jgi:hypothetical protein
LKFTSFGLALTLALGSITPGSALASDHLIPAAELHAALASVSAEREAHIAEIQTLLRHAAVSERLGDLAKVEALVASLDDEILGELGTQSRQINADIAANGAGTWIAVGVVAAIGVTVAVLLAIRLGNE